MPRFSENSLPKYRLHRPSGRAVVTLSGQDHYLGKHNSVASRELYNRLLAEWLTGGRASRDASEAIDLNISELCNAYRKHAEGYYVKNGKPTSQITIVQGTIRYLRRLYGQKDVREFGPLALRAYQDYLVSQDMTRSTVNHFVGVVKLMFRWASNQELIPAALYHALQPVPGLKKGRTAARETVPIQPVSDDIVEATIAKLPRVVADMVRLQRLCGCRPGEIVQLRPIDLDRSKPVWSYIPASYKTEHHGIDRTIFIGPQGQAVLLPYLLRDANSHCFVPAESEAERNSLRREQRKSPMTPSQVNRRPKNNPKKAAGEAYDRDSYRQAITRACNQIDRELKRNANRNAEQIGEPKPYSFAKGEKRLFPAWAPNQLRHTAATALRHQFGIEAAQLVLGHRDPKMTLVYAERNHATAARIMGEVG